MSGKCETSVSDPQKCPPQSTLFDGYRLSVEGRPAGRFCIHPDAGWPLAELLGSDLWLVVVDVGRRGGAAAYDVGFP